MNENPRLIEGSNDALTNESLDLDQIKLTLAVMQLDAADRAVIRVAGQLIIQLCGVPFG